jgi:hypothetical protein
MITTYQMSLITHSLGSIDPSRWFRNHFVASKTHADYVDMCNLENNGLVCRSPTPSFCDQEVIVFSVTDEGKKEAKSFYQMND